MSATILLPLAILKDYKKRDELYKYSPKLDKCLRVKLPSPFSLVLIYDENLFISWVNEGGEEPGFLRIPSDKNFDELLISLFERDSKLDELTLPKMYWDGRVVSRYIVTNILLQGLYYLYNRLWVKIRWRYEAWEKTNLMMICRFLTEIEDEIAEFKVGGCKTTKTEVYIPHRLYKRISEHISFTSFSSLLAYCIAVAHGEKTGSVMQWVPLERGYTDIFEDQILAALDNNLLMRIIRRLIGRIFCLEENTHLLDTLLKNKDLNFSFIDDESRVFRVIFKDGARLAHIWTPKWDDIRELYEKAAIFEYKRYGDTEEARKFISHSEFVNSLLKKMKEEGGD